jgi:serine protease Do
MTATGLLALATAAATYGSGQLPGTAAPLTPVTQIVQATAPDVTPAEAERAVSAAKDLSTAFRVAADRVLPSVVTIETTTKMQQVTDAEGSTPGVPDDLRRRFGGENPFEGTPFEDFFRDMPGQRGFRFEMPRQRPQQGTGSGVVIDRSGLILTNNHVVAGGENAEVLVRLADGREYTATEVWTDPKTDIAVVKIDADDLVPATLGNSDHMAVGDWVLALGQPFGLESTVTAGIISATHRGVGIADRENFLQTDAAINPGNSGGPLVNLDGEVVGINTAISSRNGGNVGIGFAVPINLAKWVGDQLGTTGTVKRAYLGVGIQPVTAKLADQFGVNPRQGVVVTEVFPDTPAAEAGLQSGDVIVEYAGMKITSPQALQVVVERSELGRPHVLKVMRDGELVELKFTPQEQPSDFGLTVSRPQGRSMPDAQSSALEAVGLEIGNLDPAVAERLNMKGVEGVVITDVQSGSSADLAGLESGMVITQIDRRPVTSVRDVERLLEEADPSDGLLLLVKSGQGSRFVMLTP